MKKKNLARVALLTIALQPAFTACSSTDILKPGGLNDGVPRRIEKTFHLEYGVKQSINAAPETVWALLTDAASYKQWSTTIISLEGTIMPDKKLKLKAKISPDRTFELTVSEINKGAGRMKWESGFKPMFGGVRTFRVIKKGKQRVDFVMTERFSGAMLPMISGSLPDFRTDFGQFARDLKKAAELRSASGL